MSSGLIDELFDRVVDLEARVLPCNTGGPRGRLTVDPGACTTTSVDSYRPAQLFGIRGRSAERRRARSLADDDIGILDRRQPVRAKRAGARRRARSGARTAPHKRVVSARSTVGGQELGYLPGSADEKMSPWGLAVTDALESIVGPEVIDEVIARNLLEVLPLTHIRGRSLHDAFVIVDEAQSLERNVLLTVLSRIGQGSRVVLTNDVAQRDNLRVGRHDGVASVIEALKDIRCSPTSH
jgi:PhoH-like ATPase